MKLIIVGALLSILSSQDAFAQVTTQNPYGRYSTEKTIDKVTGSPYLSDTWDLATVKTAGGAILKDLKVKYDLMDDLLYFKSSDDKVMVFNQPISEFKIVEEGLFRNGFNNPLYGDVNTFYQVIFDGKVKLLKRKKKSFTEVLNYNEASPVKKINTQMFYYVMGVTGTFQEIKLNKKSIIDSMKDKQKEINEFLNQSKVDFKSDKDLFILFNYYNSLL